MHHDVRAELEESYNSYLLDVFDWSTVLGHHFDHLHRSANSGDFLLRLPDGIHLQLLDSDPPGHNSPKALLHQSDR